MPFQPGNREQQKAAKARLFKQQIIAVLNDVPDGEPSRLRSIAAKLVALAETGDMAAIKEVADRVEGKPPQAIVGGGEDDAPVRLETIRRIIVNSGHSDGGGVPPAA